MTKKTSKKAREKLSILKTDITITPKIELINDIKDSLDENVQIFLTTPNPEIVVMANKSKKYRDILNSSDIAIPDGVGISWGIKMLHDTEIKRIKGRELFLDLLALANDSHYKVYLLGSTDEVMKAAITKIKSNYKNIKVKGSSDIEVDIKSNFEIDTDIKSYSYIVNSINEFEPHMLLIFLGAPKQEIWASKFKNKLNAKLIATLGGSLDYFVGKQVLPPSLISKLGLEWLWRLVFQPTRFFRILNAVFVFPILVIASKVKQSLD